MLMKIAILDDYQDCVRHLDCFRLLTGHEVRVFTDSVSGVAQLAARLDDFAALVLIRERTSLPAPLLKQLPRLKLISQTGKVSGHIDVAAATALGVTIVEGVGDPTSTAELAWSLIMASARRIPQYMSHLKQGHWQTASQTPQYNTLGTVLKGKTLGVWGLGRIGGLMTHYGKAFGMKVMVWGSEASRKKAAADGFIAAASKEQFFAECDVISVHLRLNDATQGCVTAADLALMKPTALFVNTSRAELVAHGALENALISGRPGWAALDVFESEPLPADSKLLRMENVLATPHLGYVEQNSYELYFRIAFQNVVDFANGAPQNVLNPKS